MKVSGVRPPLLWPMIVYIIHVEENAESSLKLEKTLQ
jgi:hypothetical protein